ncbi:MAG: outer membrane beta-barrel protein [Bacteroidota bacterium]
MLRFTIITGTIIYAAALPARAQDKPAADTTKERALKEVSITAQKGAIERAPGKTIINVQALTANAGKTVLDVLRQSPGVTVDGQGNISMTGRQGVLVTIDGRQTYLAGDDLRDYLRSITAEEVGEIELITQPSARYDAAGNAGIINIKLRKSRRAGWNGNINSSYSVSKLYASNSTVLVNYRKNKVNIFASANYINAMGTVDWMQWVAIKAADGTVLSRATQHAAPVEDFDKQNWRAGIDYIASDKTSMGVQITGAFYNNIMHSPIIMTVADASGTTEGRRNTYEWSVRKNGTANAWLKHNFSKRSELNVNADYLIYTRRMGQYLQTETEKDSVAMPGQLVLRSQLPYTMQVHSARADHTYTAANGLKIESGGKYSYVTMDNAGQFEQYSNDTWQPDASRTNRFLYTEHISALYANATKKLGAHWDAQLGLRGELAEIRGVQEATAQGFTRSMPALFPTAYISYKPDSAHNIEVNYGRRVERPQYRMLNPFNYYTFYNSYQRGNPNLLPEYTHNLELRHSYKNTWNTSLELSATNPVIAWLLVPDGQTGITYETPYNFSTNKLATLSLNYTGKPRPWWEASVTVTGRYANVTGIYNNIPLHREGLGVFVWAQSQLTFGKWSGEVYCGYNGNMVTTPVSRDGANLYTAAGIGRKLAKDKLNIRLITNDLFYVYRNVFTGSQPGFDNSGRLMPNSRDVTLVVTYNFGQGKSDQRKDRGPEEAKRL